MRHIDGEIEAWGAVDHHRENETGGVDQLDVAPPYMNGDEQAARAPGQRQPDPFKDMRPSGDRRTGIPMGSASDHAADPMCVVDIDQDSPMFPAGHPKKAYRIILYV